MKIKWTEELKQKLTNLYSRGVPIEDLSREFNTTKGNIRTVLSRIRSEGTLVANPCKEWSTEDIEKLIILVNVGSTYNDIAKDLNRTKKAITGRIAILRKLPEYSHRLPKKKNEKYLTEELYKIRDLFNKGNSVEEIANIIDRPISSTKNKIYELKNIGVIDTQPKKLNRDKYTDEELVEYIRLYKSRDKCPADIRYCILSRFKTWSAALIHAEMPGNIGGVLDPSLPTILYLLYFEEEDFYKVGITQRNIKTRFSGAPKYQIIDELSDELDFISSSEKLILSKISNKYVPKNLWFIRNGSTECFKSTTKIKNLLSLI